MVSYQTAGGPVPPTNIKSVGVGSPDTAGYASADHTIEAVADAPTPSLVGGLAGSHTTGCGGSDQGPCSVDRSGSYRGSSSVTVEVEAATGTAGITITSRSGSSAQVVVGSSINVTGSSVSDDTNLGTPITSHAVWIHTGPVSPQSGA